MPDLTHQPCSSAGPERSAMALALALIQIVHDSEAVLRRWRAGEALELRAQRDVCQAALELLRELDRWPATT